MEGLVFGWRSAILLAALAPLLPIGIGLVTTLRNRIANRTLAALLLVLAGIATPWMIGFAGFYDRWQGLSFVPFSLPLAVPPLLWLFAQALTRGRWPPRGAWHLAPAVVQAAAKVAQVWTGYLPTVAIALDLALLVSALFYGWHALALLRAFRTFLAQERSDDRLYAGIWLSRAIVAVLVLIAIAFAYKLVGQFVALGYRGNMGQYIAVAFFALYLGIEGWRHARLDYPTLPDDADTPPPPAEARDWHALGEEVARRTRAEGWARDPQLSLDRLARHMGLNRAYVSRALNEGLGTGFSAFVNGLRSEEVARALDAGSEATLLDLALEAGFASKATFNRAFMKRYGMSPSAYRARLES